MSHNGMTSIKSLFVLRSIQNTQIHCVGRT